MTWTIAFWTAFGVIGFAFALAVQMRVMTALVLRRALAAKFGKPAPHEDAAAVRAAAAGDGTGDRAAHLLATYPRPLSHLRLARRASVVCGVLFLGVLAARRLMTGGF